MTTATRPLMLLIVVLLVSACGCRESAKKRLVGKWQGVIEYDDAAVEEKLAEAKNPIARALLEKFIEAAEAGTLDFELKRDGGYTSTIRMGPFSKDSYGQWEVLVASGKLVTVRLTGHDGNVEQPTLTFVDADTFTIKAVDKAKDIAVFRCRRIQDG